MTQPPSRPAGDGELLRARLPAWCLPDPWPRQAGQPVPAHIAWRQGRIATLTPAAPAVDTVETPSTPRVLPGLLQAHSHLDKAYTDSRAPARGSGLLAAIECVAQDRQHWSADDLRDRMSRGLREAWNAGVKVLRTHIDWVEGRPPLAWDIAGELAQDWRGRVRLERVALVPLRFFAERTGAASVAQAVAGSGDGALLGGFVHTSNWNPQALAHMMDAAQALDLDLDLHIDEETDPQAQGVAMVVALAARARMEGVIACSHACALASQPQDHALAILDTMATLPGLRLICLPTTNLLLQDAAPGITPRQRGITRVKEARSRGIPVLMGSDNVQDPFCRGGTVDPIEAFLIGVYAAQLDDPFDRWTDTICRHDWLQRQPLSTPLGPGMPADLVCFDPGTATAWPSLNARRSILRDGRWLESHEPTTAPHLTNPRKD